MLEAGSRHENHEFVNDEWESFAQLAWTDMRTTSGSWRVARDFANLPAWIVKAVGGSTTHWAGASLRFQEHELRTRTVYGAVKGANLLDWPINMQELAPYYAKAEDRMGVTLTNGIAGLPGNNNYRVLEKGAKAIGYQKVSTGRMAINSADRHDRGSCQQIGFCFQGCKSGAKWSTLYAELPKGEATGKLEVRPNAHVLRIEHDARGKVTGVVYADKAGVQQRQKARIVAVAGNSIESPRILLNSASSMFKNGLANSSGQVGRNYMRHLTGSVYGVFDKPVKMWRGTTMAGIVQDEAHHDPKRGFVGGYEMETLSLGLPFMAAFLDPGAWGREIHHRPRQLREHGRPLDRGRGHAAGVEPHHAVRQEGQVRDAGRERPFRRPSERHRHADPCLQAGQGDLRGGRRDADLPDDALPVDAQSRHQPDVGEQAGRRGQQVGTDPRHRQSLRLRRQHFHDRRRGEPDPDHRGSGDAPGRLHRGSDAKNVI